MATTVELRRSDGTILASTTDPVFARITARALAQRAVSEVDTDTDVNLDDDAEA
jgi:hypothetical protein